MAGVVNRLDHSVREWQAGLAPQTAQTLPASLTNTGAKSDYSIPETNRIDETNPSQIKQEDKELSAEEVRKEVDKLNEQLKLQSKTLRFKFSEDAGKYFVQVINPATQEVMDTLPPEYLIDLSAKMKALIGLFIDKKM